MFIFFEGINFNVEWVKGKTFKQFCEHEKHHGLSKEKMKEFYDCCKKKDEKKTEQMDEET